MCVAVVTITYTNVPEPGVLLSSLATMGPKRLSGKYAGCRDKHGQRRSNNRMNNKLTGQMIHEAWSAVVRENGSKAYPFDWPFVDERSKEQYERMAEWLNGTLSAGRPQIVVLCGSTRFSEAFRKANLEETLVGKIVLSTAGRICVPA
jgi:hypothetical protein